MMPSLHRYFLAGLLIFCKISAFSWVGQRTKRTTGLFSGASNVDATADFFVDNPAKESSSTSSRRQVLKGAVTTAGSVIAPSFLLSAAALLSNPSPSNAAADARCDAVDPRCGTDGVLRDTGPRGKPIPAVANRITHVVQLVIDVGERREEVGFLRIGLYGEACPRTVRTMLEFLTLIGITGAATDKKEQDLENSIGLTTSVVSILQGGIVPEICPGKGIEFGVPSQKKAYARIRGLRDAKNFVPQNRPEAVSLESEPSTRTHDVAGLVSIPEKGIGYATSGGDLDAAYASAFLITTDENSDLLDTKLRRRVIGQVIDDESMEFLARLSSLPIQKKGSGSKGPPLLKVTVLDVGVQKVGAPNPQGKKKK